MNHTDAYDVRLQLARAFPKAGVTIGWDGPRSYVVYLRESVAGRTEILTPNAAKRLLEERRIPA